MDCINIISDISQIRYSKHEKDKVLGILWIRVIQKMRDTMNGWRNMVYETENAGKWLVCRF